MRAVVVTVIHQIPCGPDWLVAEYDANGSVAVPDSALQTSDGADTWLETRARSSACAAWAAHRATPSANRLVGRQPFVFAASAVAARASLTRQ